MNLKSPFPGAKPKAFTFVELLVTVAVLLLLSTLMLPVFARARQSPQASQCLSNERQLMLAALMYADDNAGLWFPNQPSSGGNQRDWITGYIDFNPANPNNTNLALFTDPATDFFAKYIQSPLIFHCPADQSFVVGEGPRIRSVSASQAVGTQWVGTCGQVAGAPVTGQWLTGVNSDCDMTWRRYGKAADMVAPAPSAIWVFADEHPLSINDSGLAVECAGTTFGSAKWIDLPASYHDGAGSLSFADGHAELHKWAGKGLPGTPNTWNGSGYPGNPVINTPTELQDIQWLQQRTSSKAN